MFQCGVLYCLDACPIFEGVILKNGHTKNKDILFSLSKSWGSTRGGKEFQSLNGYDRAEKSQKIEEMFQVEKEISLKRFLFLIQYISVS